MMSDNQDSLRKQEEALARRYRKDVLRIEDQQDDIKKHRGTLQEVDEGMLAGAMRIHERLEAYTSTTDGYTYQIVATGQNEVFFAQVEAHQGIAQRQEDLAREQRRLADEREERERRYKEEMRGLDEKNEGN